MPNNNPQTTPQQQIAKAAEGANKAAERLESTAEHAASVAIEKVRQVREEAQSGIQQQRDLVADRIRRIGGVLRSGSQTLSTDDPLAQQLFDTAGDRIDRLASYIGNITPGQLADDVHTLARRRPGLFFGGSFIVGLALGRFAKSSASAITGAVGSGGRDESRDEYEQTSTPRKNASASRQGGAQGSSQRSASAGGSASGSTGQRSASRTGQSSASAESGTPGTASTLPQGVSGSAHATIGTGSAHGPGPNAGPSYGASSTGSTGSTGSKPQSEGTPASAKAQSVEPGEGSKS
ncbi:MAG: hypothetical protein JWN48_5865 [Myxococcaceae bacterium]|nr:hypothetical protein [Myxococcaceae bacterium]